MRPRNSPSIFKTLAASGSAPGSALAAFPSALASLAREIGERLGKRSEMQTSKAREALGIPQAVNDAIAAAIALGVTDPQAWALLVRWLDERTGSDVLESTPATLRLRLERLDPAVSAAASAIFERHLGVVAAV